MYNSRSNITIYHQLRQRSISRLISHYYDTSIIDTQTKKSTPLCYNLPLVGYL